MITVRPKRVVLAGGTGQVGQILARHYLGKGWDVCVLSRSAVGLGRHILWDGQTLGTWASEIDGADVVINLAGRTVNCRYTEENLQQMMDSRVHSTRVVGEAILQAAAPPRLWLQMSTATIYAHRYDAANDELTGILGGSEPDVPRYWDRSVDIAKQWEATLASANTPLTRKVALRASMIMSPDAHGIFDVLCNLTRRGLGGPIAGGKQFVSWIHDSDVLRAVDFIDAHDNLAGAVNLCGPEPVPQAELMQGLRSALGVGIGLPAAAWMARVGALFMRTDAELVLKSRRVVPARLLAEGFHFEFPSWDRAAKDLVRRAAREKT